MLKLLVVIGARPQIIKASALSRAVLAKYSNAVEEVLVHTGQHYDHLMSQIFIDQMQLNQIHYNIGVGTLDGFSQIARMVDELKQIITKEKPDCVLVFGDTRSTLAGAMAAADSSVPLAHVEAGMRAFDKTMPEEINRVFTDYLSSFLFCSTIAAKKNLGKEGLIFTSGEKPSANNPLSVITGDVMFDNLRYFKKKAGVASDIFNNIFSEDSKIAVLTIHRAANTDFKDRLKNIIEAVLENATRCEVRIIFPMHPRTEQALKKVELLRVIEEHPQIIISEPLDYIQMLMLIKKSIFVLTDSGGLQKEAAILNKPAMVFRDVTEWQELIDYEMVTLVDDDKDKVTEGFDKLLNFNKKLPANIYGDGNAAEKIIETLLKWL